MTDTSSQPDSSPDESAPDTLGEAGKKAIAAERARASAAEKQLKALQTQLDEATSRLGTLEATNGDLTKQVTERDLANARLTVGLEKGLTVAQIGRLQGATPEEIAADADELLQLFPAAAPAVTGPTTPRADPSQGARGPGKSTPQQEFAAWAGPLLNP